MGDEKIIAKIQAGETEYFSSIYDSYIDSIYRYVYLKTSVKEVAEDITSDVFLSALKNISRFKLREGASIKSWLYRIAHNKVIDFYKTNKENIGLGDYLEKGIEDELGKQLDDKNKVEEILEFLQTIKKDQREVMMLRIWEDLSYKEISEITGKSADNCKKIVSRTLQLILGQWSILLFIFIWYLGKIL